MNINTTTIKTLQNPEKGYSLTWDDNLKGFGIRVTSAGSKAYIVQAKVHGKDRRVTLGKVDVLTPKQARDKAKRELVKMGDGRDPVAEKREQRAASITLGEIAEEYQANRRTKEGLPLKASTKADIAKHLSGTFADWKSLPVSSITRDMVKKRYLQHCQRSIAQANQSMRILRALINYAAATCRDAKDNPIITDNPVRALSDASMLRAVAARTDKVPLEDVGRWWAAVETMRADPALTTSSRSAADLVALLALTGLRVGEARALRWEDVDLDEGSLILRDTKNRTELLRLPLSAAAVGILESRRADEGFVFPARSDDKGHLTDCRGQLELLAGKTGITVTAHDLRRTFSAVAGAVNVELWRTKAHSSTPDERIAA